MGLLPKSMGGLLINLVPEGFCMQSIIQIEQNHFPEEKTIVLLGWQVKGEEYNIGLVSLSLCITVSHWLIYVSP